MSNICDFEGILKTECDLQHLIRNSRIKNLDDFERDEIYTYLWSAGLKHERERMNICYFMNRCLVMFFERRESQCHPVLMKHRRKVEVEQVIILLKVQQLKTKNINDVPGQLFCCQYKAKFFLETNSLC